MTTKLEQAQPVQGAIALNIKKLRLGLLSVPTTCRTAEPIALTLDYEGPLVFDGETKIPHLTGCGLLGPTLGTLLSGPGNAYHLTLGPLPAG